MLRYNQQNVTAVAAAAMSATTEPHKRQVVECVVLFTHVTVINRLHTRRTGAANPNNRTGTTQNLAALQPNMFSARQSAINQNARPNYSDPDRSITKHRSSKYRHRHATNIAAATTTPSDHRTIEPKCGHRKSGRQPRQCTTQGEGRTNENGAGK
jgi:hypothetical protein